MWPRVQVLFRDHFKFHGHRHLFVELQSGLVSAKFFDGVVRKMDLFPFDVIACRLNGVGELDRIDGTKDFSAFTSLGTEFKGKPLDFDAMASAASFAFTALCDCWRMTSLLTLRLEVVADTAMP